MALFVLYALVPFVFGTYIGSFLNVIIIRTPLKESFVSGRSHCMTCGKTLKWYHLVPVFSWLFLRGKCGYCKSKISFQYPLVEFLNGFGWGFVSYYINVIQNGMLDSPIAFSITAILYMIALSVLIVISGIDIKIYEIPYTANGILTALGLVALLMDLDNWQLYIIGMCSIGGLLFLIQLVSGGRAMGGGDVFLMAAAGLLLGWKNIILAFVLGCIIGSIIHITIMKIKKDTDNVLPFGPYLSAGIVIAMIFGDKMINWYLSTLGF
jgi:leader peptidase (prepilin peptidase)/N-methyltransferase